MPGGGPEVTAPRGVREATRQHTWLDPAPSVGSQHSSRPIWEMPPVLVPLCQHLLVRCPPTPLPLSSTATGPLPPTQWATSLGFPCWPQQIPQETCSTSQGLLGDPEFRVTCCRQGCGPAGSDKDPAVMS